MTDTLAADWQARATQLADQLILAGELRTQPWADAVRAVPRHALVPRYYEYGDVGAFRLVDSTEPSQRADWLHAIYSDTTLVTTLADLHTGAGTAQVATSSTTMPSLMVRMLEDLDVHGGHKVLEIGTATGYNAALLSARLGDRNVYSVDVQPELVEAARARLAAIGYRPTLDARDGATGLPEYAPYDRIIATCAVPRIPTAWIEQTRPGGIILTDLGGPIVAGNVAKLYRGDDPVVQGRFLTRGGAPDGDRYGAFMPMRHTLALAPLAAHNVDTSNATTRTTEVDPALLQSWHHPLAFLAQLRLPATTTLSETGDEGDARSTQLTAADGSWCDVTNQLTAGHRLVREGGPQRLWRTVEAAHRQWTNLGQPGWGRLGITATTEDQHVWLDNPGNPFSWPLPNDKDR